MRLSEGIVQATRYIEALHQEQPGDRLFITSILNYAGWERHYRPGLTTLRGYAVIDERVKLVYLPPPEETPLLERRVTVAWLYAAWLLGETGLLTMPRDALAWGTSGLHRERVIAATAAHFLIPERVAWEAADLADLAWRCDVTRELAEIRLRQLPPALTLRYLHNAAEWRAISR